MNTKNRQPNRWGTPLAPLAAVSVESDTLIEQYLKWKKTYAPRAAKAYEVWVRRFQKYTNKAPEALLLADWTGFAGSLEGCFAPKSLEFALNVVHNYLRFWNEQGRLRQFPLYLARVPKATACSHNAATEQEYRAMVQILEGRGDSGLRDRAILMLLHDTGMRVGELVQLEIDQIEEDASAVIRTEKTVQRRRVFWNPETDDVLHQWVIRRLNAGASTDWVFVCEGEHEHRLTTRSIQRMVKLTAMKAGISRKLSPHSFRHALIHRLAKLGVPDALIAQVVGHGSPHSISHYTKLSRPEFEEIARKQFREFALTA